MNIKDLKIFLEKNQEPKFRLKQILKSIYQDGILDFNEMTNLPKELREKMEKNFKFLSFEIVKVLMAKDKKSAKAAFKLCDNNIIESVLMSIKPGFWSVCVSSQVGCAVGCNFCATGQIGFKRNLTSEEITDQVLFWQNWLKKTQPASLMRGISLNRKKLNLPHPDLPLKIRGRNSDEITHSNPPFQTKGGNKDEFYLKTFFPSNLAGRQTKGGNNNEDKNKITNIVFMGMGEPFLNWENVQEALKDLTDKELYNFGARSISASTIGLPEGIRKLANEFPQVNLAISLHSANDKLRTNLTPITKRFNLKAIKNAIENYLEKTNRKVFIEYVMIDKINDRDKDARELTDYIKSFNKYYLIHINLISYNEAVSNLKPAKRERMNIFKSLLEKQGLKVTIRKSLGSEIKGACGQLAGK